MQRKANEKRLKEFKQELLIFSNGCINKTVNVKFLSDTQKTQTSQCQFFDLVANFWRPTPILGVVTLIIGVFGVFCRGKKVAGANIYAFCMSVFHLPWKNQSTGTNFIFPTCVHIFPPRSGNILIMFDSKHSLGAPFWLN